jgi:Tfp pilus assembly protein FimV
MSITATRTRRFTAPPAPTRTAVPRRRTLGPGASVVGRADRPVLRFVADGEQVPAVTRRAPQRCDVPIRPVALGEFFAPEYDGDEQALEIVRPRPSSLRLTRRGRLAVFAMSLAAMLGVGFVAATGSLANDQPEPTRVVTVHPGQTLWDIASGASAGGDVRATMAHLEAINHLDSTTLQVGQHLRVPQ